jgi:hypothetical protein
VKVAVIGGLGAWLPHVDTFPKEALARLGDGLKEKDVLRRAHLRAILSVCPAVLLPLLFSSFIVGAAFLPSCPFGFQGCGVEIP